MVLAQEQRRVELPGLELGAVGARDREQAAVVDGLGSERDPDADELAPVEAPVAHVLVPARHAREARVLGHDAVVVVLRQQHLVAAHERLQRRDDLGVRADVPEQRVAAERVQQPPGGAPALGVDRGRRPGVVHVGLVLDRGERRGQGRVDDVDERADPRRTQQVPAHQVAVAREALPSIDVHHRLPSPVPETRPDARVPDTCPAPVRGRSARRPRLPGFGPVHCAAHQPPASA